jgi:hypothetical protein
MPARLSEAFAKVGFESPTDTSIEERPAPGAVEQIAPGLIRPGLVILDLDPVLLLGEPAVICTANPATRPGPFVCVGLAGTASIWAGITTKYRLERLELLSEWRLGGREAWRTRRQFLTDGATLYKGPNVAFAAASWREVFSDPEELPRLTPAGMEAVARRLDAARGRKRKARRREERRRESFSADRPTGTPP